jgi:hypothetical protein
VKRGNPLVKIPKLHEAIKVLCHLFQRLVILVPIIGGEYYA